jgi:hypothetical protein
MEDILSKEEIAHLNNLKQSIKQMNLTYRSYLDHLGKKHKVDKVALYYKLHLMFEREKQKLKEVNEEMDEALKKDEEDDDSLSKESINQDTGKPKIIFSIDINK